MALRNLILFVLVIQSSSARFFNMNGGNADEKNSKIDLGKNAPKGVKDEVMNKLNQKASGGAVEVEVTQGDASSSLLSQNVQALERLGWEPGVAEIALKYSNNNVTAAILSLDEAEETITKNFEQEVQKMLGSNWHELVARQALVAQYSIDELLEAGEQLDMDEEYIKSIHPTLKKEIPQYDSSLFATDSFTNALLNPTTSKGSSTGTTSTTASAKAAAEAAGDNIEMKTDLLVELGWELDDAKRALSATKHDFGAALEILVEEENQNESFMTNLNILNQLNWNSDIARTTLRQHKNNVTSAVQALDQEESLLIQDFDVLVAEMVNNGWHEYVARQALMTQYAVADNLESDEPFTISPEILKTIRPTLKKLNV